MADIKEQRDRVDPNDPELDDNDELEPGEDELDDDGEEEVDGDGDGEEHRDEPEDDRYDEAWAADNGPPDLGRRILCPDGACIGVIGSDGRCKECGAELADEDKADFEEARQAEPEDDGDGEDREPDPAHWPLMADDGDPELDERELCPDGMCIGVIGANGRCKECGKPVDWTEDDEPDEPDGDEPDEPDGGEPEDDEGEASGQG